MSSPEETQLADDLRHLVAGRQFTPDIEEIERRGRRQQQRGRAVRAVAGLGVLGLAVAGGLVAVHRTSVPSAPSAPSAGGKPSAGAPSAAGPAPAQALTVAYVRQKISAALSMSGYLIKTVQDNPTSGVVTIWTDPATGNTMLLQGSGAGKTAYWEHDYYKDRVLHWHQTQVNYGPRTWWVFDEHASGPITGPVPPGPVGGNYTTAAQVKQILARGVAKIVGHPVVDGRHTIELAITLGPITNYIYADSHTYQVVRTVRQFPAPLSDSITSDYYWTPSTAAMAQLINHPRIPAGFTQVPAD
jgi:hypothetical protein